MRMSEVVLLAVLASPVVVSAQNTISNFPPTVAIVLPTNGSRYLAPADISILANAVDREGPVVEVSFFANQHYIGGVTNPPPTLSPLPPWRILWEKVPTGSYSLQARATDSRGAIGWSAPVRVEVGETNRPPPATNNIVTIEAADPVATEQDPRLDIVSDSALFLVRRHGPTNINLTVHYRVGGSASNGLDYTELSGEVRIPAGSRSGEIWIDPVDDSLVEGTETVIVTVIPPPCFAVFPPPPECYIVGEPRSAAAFIRDNDFTPSNTPPHVRITAPASGQAFPAGSDITIDAVTVDPDGYAPMIEFFANDVKIGEQIINFIQAPPDGTPIEFSFAWQDVAAGMYSLTARATDDEGATRFSEPVRIVVGTNQPPPPPTNTVVTIETVDPVASESDPRTDALPDNALLRVRRQGPTNINLTVFYRVGGSASNGVDYTRLSGEVTIPAGSRGASIEIQAIDDDLAEGTENVIVTLIEPPCVAIFPPPPECYRVGLPGSATAFIRDNDFSSSNLPPAVRITAPENGARFPAGSHIRIGAVTVDRDGYAPMIEFFANGRKIGEEVIHFVQPPPDGTPIEFSFIWSNVVAGSYTLTAKGTDDEGAMAFSAPVGIRVGTNEPPPPPPPTNVVVSIAAIDSYASEGLSTNRLSSNTDPVLARNTAEFAVRRAGPTNDPVTVRYRIGGTASNGIDYVRLPGEVTVPAGSRLARILVAPLDDNLVEGIETVVLELAPAPNDPPSYLVGEAARAAAIITDNDSPRPRCVRLAGGVFHLCYPGTNGNTVRLEASTDLANWTTVCTSVVTDGAFHFVDADACALPHRFYRVSPAASLADE